MVKNLPADAGDMRNAGFIPGSGSSGPSESRGALVCWGSCHKQLLKQQKLIVSQMWGLAVQDQSVSRVGSC